MNPGKVSLEFLDKNKVIFKCRYHISKERLWNSLTKTDELNKWFMKTEWDFREGGKGTHWVGLLAGWDDFLLALESHLTNKEIEDHFDHLCQKYKNLLGKKYGFEKGFDCT